MIKRDSMLASDVLFTDVPDRPSIVRWCISLESVFGCCSNESAPVGTESRFALTGNEDVEFVKR